MNKRYPVKQDVNLAQVDEAYRKKLLKTALVVLILVLCAAALCKFAVLDRFQALRKAEAAALTAETQLEQVQEKTAGYSELQAKHRILTLIRQTVDYHIDPLDCLELLETHLLDRADVSALLVDGEVISVQFSGLTLEEVSEIYSSLMAHKLVENVQVFTASTGGGSNQGDQVTASMTIHLTAEKEDGSAS